MPDLKKMLTLEALSEALPSWLKRSTKPEYNADEIDSTLTTNQFVTASDKDNWNAKGTYSKPSGGIPKSDLSSIVQTSLEKADSALQSETDPTVPSWAKQTNKPSYTQDEVADGSTYKRVTQNEKDAWSGKQNALTTVQMSAVNSGITAEGVAQISTNQTNILYATENGGGLNLLQYDSIDTTNANGVQYTINDDMSITATRIATSSNISYIILKLKGNSIDVRSLCDGTNWLVGVPNGSLTTTFRMYATGGTGSEGYLVTDYGSGAQLIAPPSGTTYNINLIIRIEASYNAQNLTFKPMITKHADALYQPYALPNHDLTILEAEDRAALAEVVNSGAKNKLWYDLASLKANNSDAYWTWNGNVATHTTGVSVTVNSDMSLSISGNPTGGAFIFTLAYYNLTTQYAGMLLSGCPTGGNYQSGYALYVTTSGDSTFAYDTGNGVVINNTGINAVRILGRANAATNGKVFKPMMCTEADWKVSQKFVPYAKSNYDLTSLTSGLSATAYTPVRTASNYVKNIEGGYIRIGNLVIVNIRCTVNIAIPTSSPFITGLPYPIIQYGQGYGGASVTNNKGYNMTLIGTGSIAHSEADPIPVNTTLIMSTAYFAK